MAIDTAAKRKSCVGVGLFFLRMGIVPDGSDLSASQRLHTNGLYSGIVADVPVAVTAIWLARSTATSSWTGKATAAGSWAALSSNSVTWTPKATAT